MTRKFSIALALATLAGAAQAQSSDPLSLILIEPVRVAADVNRETPIESAGFAGVALSTASPSDIDANGDGTISFEELAKFDLGS